MSIHKTRNPVLLFFALLVLILLIVSHKGHHRSLVERKIASAGDPPGGPRIVPAAHPSPLGRPNIIFVLTDDLSLNLLQFMPHVLKMERNGASFANYFVTDSLCCPSRSSIFTGEFPHNTGVFRNIEPDGGYGGFNAHGNEPRTFAVALQRAGYKTAMLGKYLNGYEPTRNGPAVGWNEWDVAGLGYPEFDYFLNENGKVVHYGKRPHDYLTDVLSHLAIKFIQQSKATPYFMEVATFAPHSPYIPATRDAHAFPGLRAPHTPAYNAAPVGDAAQWLTTMRPLSQSDTNSINSKFRMRARSVLAIDQLIRNLKAAVAAAGQEKNTYFIFSSDNGIHMGEHRLTPGKMTAYDTDIHVPLVVTGPGVAAGVRDEVVENTDLCATIAELAGSDIPNSVDGRSLVPLIRGEQVPEWRTLALVEHHGPMNELTERNDPDVPTKRSGNPPSYEAIRARDSVYVEYDDGMREYHDYASDPYELRNGFSTLSPDKKASLHAAVDALRICHGAKACWQAARPTKIPTVSKVSG
jgi:N-acetylglucosamine-6-sulfatase